MLKHALLTLLIGSASSLRLRVGSSSRWSPAHRYQWSPRMQDYDLGRKEFDLLELQSFRRETVLQYSLINRSEQLRLLLLSLSAVVSACAPAIAAELFQSPGSADSSVAALGISAASALSFAGLAYREKAARGQKLRRLEREFSIGELSATQPASSLAGARTVQLVDLRDKR